MLKMKEIHPHKTETYRIGFDDHCLVISSGSRKESPKVYLSKSMCQWIVANQEELFKNESVGSDYEEDWSKDELEPGKEK